MAEADEVTTPALAAALLLLLLLGMCAQIAREAGGKRGRGTSNSNLLLCVLALIVSSAFMIATWQFYLSTSREDSDVAFWRSARGLD